MVNILSKMEEEAEGTLELLWKKVDPEDLKPGDHIYSHKRYGSYSHHDVSGIYVGGGFVIHFTRTEPKKAKVIPLPKSQPSVDRPPCPCCGYDEKEHLGVVRTCLDCFRRGKEKLHSIQYYVYEAPRLGHRPKKSGNCQRGHRGGLRASLEEWFWRLRPPTEQLRVCEHFATHCKTGQEQCEQMSFYNEAKVLVKKVTGIRMTRSSVPRYQK